FSSRRRHTRCLSDWSSDVCSSDLTVWGFGNEDIAEAPDRLDVLRVRRVVLDDLAQARDLHVDRAVEHLVLAAARELHQLVARQQIGRASCRERVYSSVGAGTLYEN